MIRAVTLAAALCTVTAVAVLAAPTPVTRSAQANSAPYRQSLEQARRDARQARERVAEFDRQAREATVASRRAELAAVRLAAQVQQAEASLAETQAELALATQRRQDLDSHLAREREPLSRLVAGLEALVRRPPVLALAQPGSIEDAVHLRAVVAAVAPQIRSKTAALRDDIETARRLEAATVRAANARRASRARLEERRAELASLSAKRLLEAKRATGAADREAERAYLAGQQARNVETLMRRLQSAPSSTATVGPITQGPEDYRLPVAGAIAKGPGSAATVSLIPQPGAQVVAPAAGRVVFAGPYRGYGSIVIVQHPEAWVSLITGLETLQTRVGQNVLAGSPIGLAPRADPAIGIELRRNGKPVDPLGLAQ